MLKRISVAVLAATALVLTPAATAQAAPTPIDVVGLDFNFINANSDMCLGVPAGAAVPAQGRCDSARPFRWRFAPTTTSGLLQIRNAGTGQCLGADRANAVLAGCDGTPARAWRMIDSAEDDTAQLRNAATGRCLTIAGGGTRENGRAALGACDDQRSRRWTVKLLSIPFLGQIPAR